MITEVVMRRELFGMEISQKSKSEFFSATDLVRAGNRWRAAQNKDPFRLDIWLSSKGTKEFISELEKQFGVVKINARGKNQHTWVHPFLFIDIALAISPTLKIQVYSWLVDALLKYRNDSGDSYKKMSGAIFSALSNKRMMIPVMQRIAARIRLECDVTDWQGATEDQLMLRDKMHDNIALLTDVLRDIDVAVDVGIEKTKKWHAERCRNKELRLELSSKAGEPQGEAQSQKLAPGEENY